jgi:alpha-tubulin suppressor-like RCC1 family protein
MAIATACSGGSTGPHPHSSPDDALAAGDFSTCALDQAGAAHCWGRDAEGELGIGDGRRCPPPSGGGPCTGGDSSLVPVASSGGHVFAGLSGAVDVMCGLTPGGDPWCWGQQLAGLSNLPFSAVTPTRIGGAPSLVTISAGALHACGLSSAGAAYCWGANTNGQLGTGDSTDQTTAVAVRTGLRFTSISVGFFQTCAVTAEGAAYCWGDNGFGELGNPAGALSQTTPIAVAGGHTFVSLRAGAAYTCGLTAAGQAYCWGLNVGGQLGDGSLTARTVPVPVTGGLTFTAIYVDKGNTILGHTCGITATGSTYCWGEASSGTLGASSAVGSCGGSSASLTCSTVPVPVAGGHRFALVSIGNSHACGITVDGVGYCWGQNDQGQLGDGTTIARPTPVRVAGHLGFK